MDSYLNDEGRQRCNADAPIMSALVSRPVAGKPDRLILQLRCSVAEAMAQRITAACRKRGMSVTRFGRDAVGDPRLVPDLRKGRRLRPATRDRIVAFLTRMEGC